MTVVREFVCMHYEQLQNIDITLRFKQEANIFVIYDYGSLLFLRA